MQRPRKNQIFIRGELRESVCRAGEQLFLQAKLNGTCEIALVYQPSSLVYHLYALSIHSSDWDSGRTHRPKMAMMVGSKFGNQLSAISRCPRPALALDHVVVACGLPSPDFAGVPLCPSVADITEVDPRRKRLRTAVCCRHFDISVFPRSSQAAGPEKSVFALVEDPDTPCP